MSENLNVYKDIISKFKITVSKVKKHAKNY